MHIIQRDFLMADQLSYLQTIVRQKQSCFSRVTVNPDYRSCFVLYHPFYPRLYGMFTGLLNEHLPMVQEQLGLSFSIGEIEMQITASGDDHYYKVHQDNSFIEYKTRCISYVYYFDVIEREFTGGHLRLHDETDTLIQPEHNTIIWFPSDLHHEVEPVHVPSQEFLASRFTCNGWVRSIA